MSGYTGAGGGSGGITTGQAVTGGTPSTLLWTDAGGLVQSGAAVTATATTQLRLGNGTLANPTYAFAADSNSGIYERAAGFVDIVAAGAGGLEVGSNSQVQFGGAWTVGFVATTNVGGAVDSGWSRVAAGVIGQPAGSWQQNSSGEIAILASDYTNSTATFSNTALSVTCLAGRKYNFDCRLYITESTAAEGWKLDFNGGGAAATLFICNAFSTAETGIIVVLANATSAALATVINATTTVSTGVQFIDIHGFFQPSGAGTFILRGAQNSHSTGTFTIKKGSSLILRDTATV